MLIPSALTLSELIIGAIQRHGDRLALVADAGEFTYSDLDRESNRLAAYLASNGVGRGDRVALHLANGPEYVVADLAILKLCAVKVPLNDLMAAEELAYCLEHCQANVFISDPRFVRPSAFPASLKLNVELSPDRASAPWCEADEDAFARIEPVPSDIAVIGYTGGTTGKPKGVVHVQSTLATNLLSHVVCGDIRSDEVMLLMTPLPHSAGFHLLACLIQGGTIILKSKFDPQSFLACTLQHQVTWSFAVPTMIYRLLDHLKDAGSPKLSLRTLVYGAAPMNAERLAEGLQLLGPVFLQLYGQTECPNFITTLTKEDHLDPSLLTSCGRAVPFAKITLRAEDGNEAKVGEVGEVEVRSPYNLVAYHNNPEATEAALIDGALRTGDLAYKNEGGYVFLVDRAKDMIISGGMNVYSVEVEGALRKYPAVREAAVVSVNDPDWGERVVAVIVADGKIDQENIRAQMKRSLSSYKVPKDIIQVEALPLTTYGKIDKKSLRANLADKLGSSQ